MRQDSKNVLETKILVLTGARNHLKRETTFADWNNALGLSPVFRNHEYFPVAKELYRYICDALEPSVNYFWWLKSNRPEEKRSQKECMIAWIEWMIDCLNEDLQVLAEKERQLRNWNPITHPDGPGPRIDEGRPFVIKFH